MKHTLNTVLFTTLLLSTLCVSATPQSSRHCPEVFHQFPLMSEARLCHQFGETAPASLSYFTPASPSTVLSFYRQHLPQSTSAHQGERVVITTLNKNGRLVISADPHGSQVDILITPE